MRILVDVDGVLADFVGAAVEFARDVNGTVRTHEQCTSWDVWEAWGIPHFEQSFATWLTVTSGCKHFAVLPGAQAFVAELRKRGEVVFVTSPYTAVRGWCDDRLAWLGQHFDAKPADVVFCKRKELVCGDVLIDDSVLNVTMFPRAAVLFEQPWNQYYKVLGQFKAKGYADTLKNLDRL